MTDQLGPLRYPRHNIAPTMSQNNGMCTEATIGGAEQRRGHSSYAFAPAEARSRNDHL
ncbi:MAG: hypothetical protein Q8O40_05560 [Chloroflexota bacterium]|nr:hypothetical protein [Chloroflexota bacterium]